MFMARNPEGTFQDDLVAELEKTFKGCIVTKLDPTFKRGIPDLLILYKNKWATLECKKSAKASARPLQPYYVDLMNKMSFSAFIYPENKEEVINDLKRAFRVARKTRNVQS